MDDNPNMSSTNVPFQIVKCEFGGYLVTQQAYRQNSILFACTDVQKAFDFLRQKFEETTKPPVT